MSNVFSTAKNKYCCHDPEFKVLRVIPKCYNKDVSEKPVVNVYCLQCQTCLKKFEMMVGRNMFRLRIGQKVNLK